MPVKSTIRYLPASQDDLLSILDFIAQDSPRRALKFIEKLEDRIGLLEDNPHLGRVPRHPKLRHDGYRVLVVESCLVFYINRGQTVEAHRIVHGSRNLDHLI